MKNNRDPYVEAKKEHSRENDDAPIAVMEICRERN